MKHYEIVLVDFPYIDKPWESKKRPCVLLSEPRGEYNLVVVAFITGKEGVSKLKNDDVVIAPDSMNGLVKDSVIQVHKLASVMESDIVGSIGLLNEKDTTIIKTVLKNMFDL
jgi:mRNA-degrading endonuclease toxin of MazEF toxin-antitoxin module